MNYTTILYIIFLIIIIIFFAIRKGLQEGLANNNSSIVLIGDSVLNNSSYVATGKSVSDILKQKLPNVFNFAKDEATIVDCYNQLDQIPVELNKSETGIFISAGGNNILNGRSQLDSDSIKNLFDKYLELIDSVKTKFPNAKINVLNLYLPANPQFQTYANSIALWNNLLQQNSTKIGQNYNIIDTNKLLVTPNDFVYDIEPSESASEKIATAIYLTL
jgi:GDSL-like Lipase/Acylhydrolase family